MTCAVHIVDAARQGRLDLVEAAVTHGSSVNSRCPCNKSTALIAASKRGHKDIVKFLLQHDADINATNVHGYTAMDDALTGGRPDIAECLRHCGGSTPRAYFLTQAVAAIFLGHTKLIEGEKTTQEIVGMSLHKKNRGLAEVINPNLEMCSLLGFAAWKGNAQICRSLLNCGAEVNAAHTSLGSSALDVYYTARYLNFDYHGHTLWKDDNNELLHLIKGRGGRFRRPLLTLSCAVAKLFRWFIKALAQHIYFRMWFYTVLWFRRRVDLPVFDGEFGYEIDFARPLAATLQANKCLRSIRILDGMEPFYAFVPEDRRVLSTTKRHVGFGPSYESSFGLFGIDRHFAYSKRSRSLILPIQFNPSVADSPFVLGHNLDLEKRPLVILHNKFNFDYAIWGLNSFSMATVVELHRLLSESYTFLVIHPGRSLRGYSHDDHEDHAQKVCHFDYAAAGILTMDAVMELNPNVNFNQLQVSLHSRCKRFISLQGGSSRLASLFGGTNIILHKYGAEMCASSYLSYFRDLSDAEIHVVESESAVVTKVLQLFTP